MKYIKKLIGTNCYLSPVHHDDYDKFTQWLNDPEVAKYLVMFPMNITYEMEKKLLADLTEKAKILSIINSETNAVIGNVGLHNIDYVNGNAELGIMIGDKNYWNRGFGTEAIQLMLDFAFNVLNLQEVYLYSLGYNRRGMKCYEKAGFKQTGTLRKHTQIGGKRYDMHIYDILAEEFSSPFVKELVENNVEESKYGQKLSIV